MLCRRLPDWQNHHQTIIATNQQMWLCWVWPTSTFGSPCPQSTLNVFRPSFVTWPRRWLLKSVTVPSSSTLTELCFMRRHFIWSEWATNSSVLTLSRRPLIMEGNMATATWNGFTLPSVPSNCKYLYTKSYLNKQIKLRLNRSYKW